MKKRAAGRTETSISGDTPADWSDAFGLVSCLDEAYVRHAGKILLPLAFNRVPGRRSHSKTQEPGRRNRTAPARVLLLLLALDGLTQDRRCAAVIVRVAAVPGGDRVRGVLRE